MRILEFWLVRHGQTEDNITKTIAGQQPGKLSDLGIKQAQITGQALKDEYFDCAYISDLARTKDTFENIRVSLKRCVNIPVFFEKILREKAGGVLEGKHLDLPKKLALEQNINLREFKAERGESWNDVYVRAMTFINILIQRHLYKNKDSFEKLEEEIKSEEIIKPKEEEEKNIFVDKKENLIEKKKIIEKEEIKSCSNIIGKNPISISKQKSCETQEDKKKIIGIHKGSFNEKSKKIKILIVSHGGFIMEFMNAISVLKNKDYICTINNRAVNCSITVIRITKSDKKNLDIETIRTNDNKHILTFFENEKKMKK